jgi:RNA polymerase sigma-70 factor (ECF subfamily)
MPSHTASGSARVLPFRSPRTEQSDAQADAAILAAAASGDRERAATLLFDRHGEVMRRVLHRILGASDEAQDARQEALLRVLDRLDRVEAPGELRGFACGVAAFVAREHLRKSARRRWLRFFAPEDVPEPASDTRDEAKEAVRAVYVVLDQLEADDRIAFCLRVIEGMELTEVAETCGVSLATAKRRIAHAQERFEFHARRHPELGAWIEGASS